MKNKVNLWETHSSTILSITLVMFLLGLCLLVEYHAYRSTHDMQERITFKVDLVPDISNEDAMALKAAIESMPQVKHVDYISRQQAAELFTEELDEDFVGFIGYNPLYPSMMVNLYADLMPSYTDGVNLEIELFKKEINDMVYVTNVTWQENVVNELFDLFYKITWFLIVFMAILLLVSFLMIQSTISIALFAQRDTIRTMQLVGAKPGFIARPFLRRSLWFGFCGSLISLVALAIATGVFNQSLTGFDLLHKDHMLWYAGIAVVITLVGMALSYISTLFAVNRYLRRKN